MEFSWSWCSLATASASILFLSFFYFLLRKSKTKSRPAPPEASGGWPIIGHLNLLSSSDQQPHVILSNLADKYGPIYTIRLGIHRCLVVSNWEVAKEIFNSTNDIIFSNRPQTVATQLMGYDSAMFAFSKYCDYWREIRKICMIKLLCNHKVSTLCDVWRIEIRALIKSIHLSCDVPLDMKKCLEELALNSMVRIVSGDTVKRMDLLEAENCREQIGEFFKMMSVLTFSDVVPYLKWLDYFKGTKKASKNTGKVMDNIMQSWLDQHKLKKMRFEEEEEEDFMGVMMEAADFIAHKFPRYDADTIIKATCQTVILGGSDTISVALTWALCLLLNNRHTLERAQQELDDHIGRSRNLEKSDIENLVYIKAIIKETLRLYPPTMLIPPRESSEDCVVAGYHIPAGTRLIVNLGKLQRDPCMWEDPLEFNPERFLIENRDVDVRGKHFHYLPFGAGRRICPGITLAMQFMELALATLLHGFDIETPAGEVVDMTGSLGTINEKASPLQVLLKPRLLHNLCMS